MMDDFFYAFAPVFMLVIFVIFIILLAGLAGSEGRDYRDCLRSVREKVSELNLQEIKDARAACDLIYKD